MRTILILIPLLLSQINTSFCQSDDNKIRVNGHAQQKFEFVGLILDLTITQVERNEYQKTHQQSINEVKKQFQEILKPMGYDTSQLKEKFPPYNYYQQNKSESYRLLVNSKEDVQHLYAQNLPGVKYNQIKYTFDQNEVHDELSLTKQAMEEAYERATFVAENLGKKVGKVIDINYSSNRSSSKLPKESSDPIFSFNQSIYITYALLDQ